MKTFYVRPGSAQCNYVLRTTEGEATTTKFDWSAKAASESTSVSSAAWAVDSGQATISGASETADIAQALVTTSNAGTSVIKVTATMADGQIDIVVLKIICSAITSTSSDYQ